MAIEDVLKAVSRPYERKARLYPAFLCLLPIVGVAIGEYGLKLKLSEALVTLSVSIGVFFLLANIAREAGKRLESQLYQAWGGIPTVQMLRHRESRIDRITKAGHHAFLSQKLGIPFPSESDEIADPIAADHAYAAGSRWLLEATRDTKKFDLLFDENIAYGYRRNALGLKRIALAICGAAIAWVLIAEQVLTTRGIAVSMVGHLSPGALGSIALSAALALIWLGFFTKIAVKSAAFAYADALSRACSILRQSSGTSGSQVP